MYDENLPAIRRYCARRLPMSEVDDATAEVFLVAWRRIESVPGGPDARYWLYGVARNVVRNTERAARRRTRLSLRLLPVRQTSAPGPEPVVIRLSEDAEVLEAIAALRPADQEILRLSVWEELSNQEIAAVLGIEAHAVTMRLSRARRRLSRRLGMASADRETWTDPKPVGDGGEQ
jgi:RNA polymerase sigma-70 factor (ECF subfamily)